MCCGRIISLFVLTVVSTSSLISFGEDGFQYLSLGQANPPFPNIANFYEYHTAADLNIRTDSLKIVAHTPKELRINYCEVVADRQLFTFGFVTSRKYWKLGNLQELTFDLKGPVFVSSVSCFGRSGGHGYESNFEVLYRTMNTDHHRIRRFSSGVSSLEKFDNEEERTILITDLYFVTDILKIRVHTSHDFYWNAVYIGNCTVETTSGNISFEWHPWGTLLGTMMENQEKILNLGKRSLVTAVRCKGQTWSPGVTASFEISALRPIFKCVGDCNQDGEVTLEEIELSRRIKYHRDSLSACSSLDANGDGQISHRESILAKWAYIIGCK